MTTQASRRRYTPALALLGVAALSACVPSAPKQLPPEPGPAVASATDTAPRLRGPEPGSSADFVASLMGQDTIHFENDRYNIDAIATNALQAQAQWLMRYPTKRATIEGHCDERGTRDYNLALGERRATAAKNYLVSLGVSSSRLNTVSYGKERPVALGSSEDAWAKNRRAVTVTIE